jgi:hypothetical protein
MHAIKETLVISMCMEQTRTCFEPLSRSAVHRFLHPDKIRVIDAASLAYIAFSYV